MSDEIGAASPRTEVTLQRVPPDPSTTPSSPTPANSANSKTSEVTLEALKNMPASSTPTTAQHTAKPIDPQSINTLKSQLTTLKNSNIHAQNDYITTLKATSLGKIILGVLTVATLSAGFALCVFCPPIGAVIVGKMLLIIGSTLLLGTAIHAAVERSTRDPAKEKQTKDNINYYDQINKNIESIYELIRPDNSEYQQFVNYLKTTEFTEPNKLNTPGQLADLVKGFEKFKGKKAPEQPPAPTSPGEHGASSASSQPPPGSDNSSSESTSSTSSSAPGSSTNRWDPRTAPQPTLLTEFPDGVCGLPNYSGVDCYQNANLQGFLSIPIFEQRVENLSKDIETNTTHAQPEDVYSFYGKYIFAQKNITKTIKEYCHPTNITSQLENRRRNLNEYINELNNELNNSEKLKSLNLSKNNLKKYIISSSIELTTTCNRAIQEIIEKANQQEFIGQFSHEFLKDLSDLKTKITNYKNIDNEQITKFYEIISHYAETLKTEFTSKDYICHMSLVNIMINAAEKHEIILSLKNISLNTEGNNNDIEFEKLQSTVVYPWIVRTSDDKLKTYSDQFNEEINRLTQQTKIETQKHKELYYIIKANVDNLNEAKKYILNVLIENCNNVLKTIKNKSQKELFKSAFRDKLDTNETADKKIEKILNIIFDLSKNPNNNNKEFIQHRNNEEHIQILSSLTKIALDTKFILNEFRDAEKRINQEKAIIVLNKLLKNHKENNPNLSQTKLFNSLIKQTGEGLSKNSIRQEEEDAASLARLMIDLLAMDGFDSIAFHSVAGPLDKKITKPSDDELSVSWQENFQNELDIHDKKPQLVVSLARGYYDPKKNTTLKTSVPLNMNIDDPIITKTASRKINAFIVHRGNMGEGHYFTYRKVNEQWYCLNDNKVFKVDKDIVNAALNFDEMNYPRELTQQQKDIYGTPYLLFLGPEELEESELSAEKTEQLTSKSKVDLHF